MNVPFFRPQISRTEIDEVVTCLQSGWLTTGPRTKQFETEFAEYVHARHAVALNSATAALHLSLEAIGIKRGDAVLVPVMTFAATAEVVRYFDAKPIFVDCRDADLNLDVVHLSEQAHAAANRGERLKAIIPVHYGGQAADMKQVLKIAKQFELRVIEDAAHCCPAEYRDDSRSPWKKVGSESDVCCYSFYANKCITTGEGGMACTNDPVLADRMRIMALHGISKDAWKRFSSEGTWYYEIVAPGFKYNLTDLASAIGIHQLRRANSFRDGRTRVAALYRSLLSDLEELRLPSEAEDRMHSWHLYAVRLRLDKLKIDRAAVIEALKLKGIGTSVHWIPLHMHPYYRDTYGYRADEFPRAAAAGRELVSLPIYPDMADEEINYVAENLRKVVLENARK